MSFTGKRLELIDEAALRVLITDQIRENKVIEYKEALPTNSDNDKKEFLADISAFANAAGGDLIYGIKATDGIASEICGLEIPNVDAEKLRLENIMRDGIEPRIPGIAIQEVSLSSSKVVIIIRIPKSWAMPHMVTFKMRPQFYSRNSAGKYPLDVSEIRTAFGLSEALIERMKRFRIEHLSKIIAGETPVFLNKQPKIVLHIIPISSFNPTQQIDLSIVDRDHGIRPISGRSWDYRYNFDGILSYGSFGENENVSYIQVFRDGAIEAVDAWLLRSHRGEKPHMYGEDEAILLKSISRCLLLQQKLGLEPPLFIMLSFLGVLGYTMYRNPGKYWLPDRERPIDRDTLLSPDVIIEDFKDDIAKTMHPIFDSIWNACGFAHSINYDNEGKWIGEAIQ